MASLLVVLVMVQRLMTLEFHDAQLESIYLAGFVEAQRGSDLAVLSIGIVGSLSTLQKLWGLVDAWVLWVLAGSFALFAIPMAGTLARARWYLRHHGAISLLVRLYQPAADRVCYHHSILATPALLPLRRGALYWLFCVFVGGGCVGLLLMAFVCRRPFKRSVLLHSATAGVLARMGTTWSPQLLGTCCRGGVGDSSSTRLALGWAVAAGNRQVQGLWLGSVFWVGWALPLALLYTTELRERRLFLRKAAADGWFEAYRDAADDVLFMDTTSWVDAAVVALLLGLAITVDTSLLQLMT